MGRSPQRNLVGIPLTLLVVLAAVLAVAVGSDVRADKGPIKIGAVSDLSGPSAETGKGFSKGVRAYFDFVNGKGGINGRKVEYMETDSAYQLPLETGGFKRFASEGIVAFIGYSTGGVMQIGKLAAAKRIVLFATSLYNVTRFSTYAFLPCANYQRVWSACIEHAIKQNPKKKLRAVMVYPGNVFGQQSVKMVKPLLKEKGVELVGSEIVGFKDIDATAQMIKIKKLNPDMVLCAAIETSISVLMRDAKKVGIDTKKVQFYNNIFGIGPVAIKLGGKDIEDLIGGSPYSFWHDTDNPGIKAIHAANPKLKAQPPVFIQGWLTALVISEGLRRLGDKEITGESLKKSLESIKNFDTGGLTAPVTYSATEHVGTRGVKMYRPNLKKGYFEAISDFITVK